MKIVLLYSGGYDSTVLLAWAVQAGHEVVSFAVDYQQTNLPELGCADAVAKFWNIKHQTVKMDLPQRDALLRIPARNTIFLAKALEIAILEKADEVWYGAAPELGSPDCSVDYVALMDAVFSLHDKKLRAPLLALPDKNAVFSLGLDLGVPLDYVHPATGPEVSGECRTSGKFFQFLRGVFPGTYEAGWSLINTVRKLKLPSVCEDLPYLDQLYQIETGRAMVAAFLLAARKVPRPSFRATELSKAEATLWTAAFKRAGYLLGRGDKFDDPNDWIGYLFEAGRPFWWGAMQLASRMADRKWALQQAEELVRKAPVWIACPKPDFTPGTTDMAKSLPPGYTPVKPPAVMLFRSVYDS